MKIVACQKSAFYKEMINYRFHWTFYYLSWVMQNREFVLLGITRFNPFLLIKRN